VRYGDLFSGTVKKLNEPGRALDIQVLLERAFSLTRSRFYIQKNDPVLDRRGLDRFYRWRARFLRGEPLAYILREKEFYSRVFYVDRRVLIPRPETELLVDRVIDWIKGQKSPLRMLDIGTGSGVLAITLAGLTGARVSAVDICPKALAVLKKNIFRHGLEDRVIPVLADLFPPLPKNRKELFDLMVSNPPYIPEEDWETLSPGVKDYEPPGALLAATGGMAVIRRIAGRAGAFLKPGGALFLEFGFGQQERVKEVLMGAGFSRLAFFDDYQGIPRIAMAQV